MLILPEDATEVLNSETERRRNVNDELVQPVTRVHASTGSGKLVNCFFFF